SSLLLISLSVLLVAFAPRRLTATQICGEMLPEIGHKSRVAVESLEPWISAEGRMPASLRRQGEAMADIDRQSWMNWSQSQLKETQNAIDALSALPSERK